MAGNLQPLDEKFAIVGPDGRPTLYFIKWCQSRQIDITEAITLFGLEEYLLAHQLQEGDGIALTPDGNIDNSPSISVRNGTGLNFDGMQNLKIADTAVTPGTYGDATNVGQFTVDQQGRITAAADVPISGGGGGTWTLLGGAYTAAGIWNQAVDGSAATITFTGLAGATDIRVIMEAVTKAVSGTPSIHVSVDNGGTWFTASGDYVFDDTAGVRTNSTSMSQMHLTNATAARDAVSDILNANTGRPVGFNRTAGTSHRLFLASSSPINAVRVTNAAGGNFTGGKFYCLARI